MSQPSSTNGPGRRWRTVPGAPAGSGNLAPSSKGRRVFWLLASLLALGRAIVALFFFLRPTPAPYFLTIAIRDYKDPRWPINPVAIQDSNLLLAHFPEERRKEAFDCQARTRFKEVLNNLPQDGHMPLVIHISAHALAQGDEIYFLAGDAAPDKTDQWLSLTEVVGVLKKNKSAHKLLLLDIVRPVIEPPLGLLRPDLAGKLEKALAQLQKQGELPFLVLCACSGDQTSLVFEEAQQSAFAFYLDRGLKGYADGAGSGRPNGHVSVVELAEYLKQKVDLWAKVHHHSRQTPVLFGQADDFALAAAQDLPTEPEELVPPKLPAYPEPLKKAWELRDQWEAQEVYLLAPRPFSFLESLLLRSEKQWRGGREQKEVEKELGDRLKDVTKWVDQAKQIVQPAPRSVALALTEVPEAERDKQEAEAMSALEELLIKFDAGEIKFDKAEDAAKAKPEFQKFWKKVEKLAPASAAQAVLVALVQSPKLTKEKARFGIELFQERIPRLFFVETVLLQRLEHLRQKKVDDPDIAWSWPEAAAKQVLRTTREAEATLAALKQFPEGLAWVGELLVKADGKRRDGEKKLFMEKPAVWGQAVELLQEAEQAYLKVRGLVQVVRQARHTAMKAMTFLPGYALCLVPGEKNSYLGVTGVGAKSKWFAAVEDTITLWQLLEDPSQDLIEPIKNTQPALADLLHGLSKHLDYRVDNIRGEKKNTGATFTHLQALLDSPRLSAARRLELWTKARQLSLQFHQDALDLERPPVEGATGKNAPTVDMEDVAELAWTKSAWKAQLSIGLLKLAGLNVGDVDHAWNKAESGKNTEAWATLGKRLRETWSKSVEQAYLASAQNKVSPSERLSFLVTPAAWTSDWNMGHESAINPTLKLNKDRAGAYWQWMAKRSQADHTLVSKEVPGLTFFAETADEYSR